MENNTTKALRISGFIAILLLVLTGSYFYLFAHTEDMDGYINLNEYYYGEIDGMISLLGFSIINIFLRFIYVIVSELKEELYDSGCVLKYTLYAILSVFIFFVIISILLLSTFEWDTFDEYTQIIPIVIYVLSIFYFLYSLKN